MYQPVHPSPTSSTPTSRTAEPSQSIDRCSELSSTDDQNNLAPPRLPSISSLLNSIPPPLERDQETTAPTQERHGNIPSLAMERPPSSPNTSLPLPPAPPPPAHQASTEYQHPYPYENGGTRTPQEDGRSPSAVSPQSQSQNPYFPNRPYYPPQPSHQVPVYDAYPPYDPQHSDPHRQRSASFNATCPPYPPPSQSLPSPYARPYPGFATSSERRNSGSDERGMSHGGLGPWRNRRRGAESPYDGNGLPLPLPTPPAAHSHSQQPQHSQQHGPAQGQWLQPNSNYSPTRPRALSISTADEFYAARPAWSAVPPMGPPHPLHHLDPSQRRSESDPYPMEYYQRPFPPAANSYNRGPLLSAGVSNDFSFLRLGPPQPDYARHPHLPLHPLHQYQQHPEVPPALPIPPPLNPAPTEAHPELRPIVLPNGMAGSAPSSAGSTSTSHLSSHSGNGLPTPISAGPTSSLPSPSTSASTGFDMAGQAQIDNGGGDASGSTDSGKYCCPHCSKRFARPSSLRIHTFSHTGEKPFTCPQCERAFSVQSNLRRHLKIHKNIGGGGGGDLNPGSTPRSRTRTAPQTRSNPNDLGGSDFNRRNSADMEEDEDQDAEGERYDG